MSAELADVVQTWVRSSLGTVPRPLGLPRGTLVLRTGDTWDSMVAVALGDDLLHPAVVLKNPVPLWQYSRHVPNGTTSPADWHFLRRAILLHNPGLDLLLGQLDDLTEPERT